MRWIAVPMFVSALLLVSCSLFHRELSIDDVMTEKEKIDQTANPAKKLLIRQELHDEGYITRNMIVLDDILVKDIVPSNNIDYDFCVLSDVETKRGKVECYIYTRNISRIARLEKGKSRINVRGQFGRFFTLLDEYFTKLEIVKASIKIRDN